MTGIDTAKAWSAVVYARKLLTAAAADLFAIAPTAPPSVTRKLVDDITARQSELDSAYTVYRAVREAS